MTNKQSTSWCFTLNNYTEQDIEMLKHFKCKYIIFGKEIGEKTETPHLQGFIQFASNYRFNSLKKLNPRISWRPRSDVSTEEFAANYCIKGKEIFEKGEFMNQKEKGKCGREYWQEQVELAKVDPDLCDPKLQLTHGPNLDRIYERAQKKRKLEHLSVLRNEWFYGDTGTGKSRTAREENPDAYIKQCNKWWNGYDGQEVVIIDDINPDHSYMANFIDQWCDHYPFPAEIKGGQITIRPKKFIITSRYLIEDIVTGSQAESWKRRFTLRRFTVPSADVEVRGLVPRT